MDTLNDYLNASPAEREAEKTRRGWDTKPPTAHTHRGKPRAWEMDGYHEATREKRTPTHRGEPRPENIPPWVHMLQAYADRAERTRGA